MLTNTLYPQIKYAIIREQKGIQLEKKRKGGLCVTSTY